MSPSDTVLIEQWIRQRDPEAMRVIVARYAGLVYASSLRILRHPEDAQDVTQECFLKLNELRRPLQSLPAFLHTAATRQAINRLRTERRRVNREQEFVWRRANQAAHTPDDIQHYVDEAIAALPVAYQTVLIRHYLQGEDHGTIAADLGLTSSGVTRRCHRAIERVRVQLKKQGVLAAVGTIGAALVAQRAAAIPPTLQAVLGRMAIAGAGPTPAFSLLPFAAISVTSASRAAAAVAVVAIVLALGYLWQGRPADGAATAPQAPARTMTHAVTANTDPEDSVARAGVPAETVEEVTPAQVPQPATGRIVSEAGYPRASAYVTADWPLQIYSGIETDAEGRFEITTALREADSLMASCQYTNRVALISGESLRTGESLDIVLDRRPVEIVGRILGPDGQGVLKAPMQARITDAAGETFDSKPYYADAQGYAQAKVPVREGDTVQVRIAACGALPAGAWSAARMITQLEAYKAFDAFHVDAATAQAIREGAKLLEGTGCYIESLEHATPRVQIGGIVQDERGLPIPGVVLELLYDVSDGMMVSVSASTDRSGFWARAVPENAGRLRIRPVHREHVAWMFLDNDAVDLDALRAGTHVSILPKGIPFQGVVVDNNGAPVGDALVLSHRMYSSTPSGGVVMSQAPIEDATSIRTDAQGRFALACLPEGEHTLQVLTRERPTAIHKVHVAPGMPPVHVRLSRGETLRGRVVDEHGEPVPFAYLRGDEWNVDGSHPLNVSGEADENGAFEIPRVPKGGTVSLMVGLNKANQRPDRPLAAATFQFPENRDTPFVLCLYPMPRWNGVVRDASTGDPVKEFEVRAGMLSAQGPIRWNQLNAKQIHADDGTFTYDFGRFHLRRDALPEGTPIPEPKASIVIGIFTDSHLPEASVPAAIGGEPIQVGFALTPHDPIAGVVNGVDGRPVAGATVVWIERNALDVAVEGAALRDDGNKLPTTQSDANGGFALSPQRTPATLLAIHESGVYMDAVDEPLRDMSVQLLPWAEVDVVVLRDGVAVPDAEVLLDTPQPAQDGATATWSFRAKTDSDGRLRFSHVPPIPLAAYQFARGKYRATSSHGQRIEPRSGECITVELGGHGAAAHGTLEFAGAPTLDTFNSELLQLVAFRGPIPEDEPWDPTVTYAADVDDRGAFAFHDLPPGEYNLWARYETRPSSGTGTLVLLAEGLTNFTLPDYTDRIDLAPLPLRPVQ